MSEISFSMKTTHPQTKMTVCERDRFILCESDHLRRTVPSRGLSGDTTTCAILTPSTITVTSVGPDERKVYFTSSSVHDASTQTPPLALNPRKRPSCQSFGKAGRIRIRPSWLCRSISASAAGNPRLPSIWNGGCAHMPLSYTPPPYQTGRGVGVDRAQEHAYDSFGMFRVTQPGPHDHAPHDAPAGAVVAPDLKRFAGRVLQARTSRGDAGAWMQLV